MYEKTVTFENFEKNSLFEAKKKPAKNARKITFGQVKKWSKMSLRCPKSTFSGRFRLPQSKSVMCVFTLQTPKKLIFFDPPR